MIHPNHHMHAFHIVPLFRSNAVPSICAQFILLLLVQLCTIHSIAYRIPDTRSIPGTRAAIERKSKIFDSIVYFSRSHTKCLSSRWVFPVLCSSPPFQFISITRFIFGYPDIMKLTSMPSGHRLLTLLWRFERSDLSHAPAQRTLVRVA